MPLCLMWILWKERNRTFEGKELPVERIKLLFVSSFLYWESLYGCRPSNHADFLGSLYA